MGKIKKKKQEKNHNNKSIIFNFFPKRIELYNRKKSIFLYFGFIFFAAAPLFWAPRVIPYNLLGFADFISPFNLIEHVYSRLFVYEPFIYGGINFAFLIAQNIPLFLFFSIFNSFGFTPGFTTLLFIFSILLVSEITMFHYLRYVLTSKIESISKYTTVLPFVGSIIYALSPYVIALIEPGHILQLILYATAPAILINLDKFLTEKKFSFKRLVFLFFLFFFNATAFANIGIVYVLLVFFALYYLPMIFLYKSVLKTLPRFFIIIVTLFVANIWWLLSFIANLQSTITLNKASVTLINALDRAVDKATVVNILFGRGESLLYLTNEGLPNTLYLSFPLLIIFLLLLFFMIYALFHSKNMIYIFQLLFVGIVSLFITKGTNEPFGNLFFFLYNNLPGFQIFRRPVSKFYWVFLLITITLAIIGMAIYANKSKINIKRVVLTSILGLSVFYLWIIFVLTPLLVPFSIPSYYFDARKDLLQQNVNKIFILPSFYGTYPKYNANFNYYYGTDFLEYIWKFSMVIPDSTEYSPNLPYKNDANKLMKAIHNGKSLCELTKNLGVSHIMVREDIAANAHIESKPQNILKMLDKSREVVSKKTYKNGSQKGFSIYRVHNDCLSPSIFAIDNKKTKIEYTWESPVKYHIKLSGIRGGETLSLLQNYSPAWSVYVDQKSNSQFINKNHYVPQNFLKHFQDLQYFTKLEYDNNAHILVKGYANGWKLNIQDIRKSGNIQKDPDGSYTVYVTIFYKTQNFFYVGIILFSIAFITALSYVLYSDIIKKRSKHVSSNRKVRR